MNTIRMLRDNVRPKLETGLEEEINEREKVQLDTRLQRCRARTRSVLHSRFVLFSVVTLCFADCIFVIGELVLDMHAIQVTDAPHTNASQDSANKTTNITSPGSVRSGGSPKGQPKHSIEEKIAHIFHYCSLSILSILMVETVIKIGAMGRKFLDKKFEVFDAFVVFVSFAIDLVFLEGLTNKPVQEAAFTLSFLLPWRVIRVVNSMIVALLHREHMKLLLVFKSKQYLVKQVDDISNDILLLQKQMAALKGLCRRMGIEDWRINQCVGAVLTESSRRKNALTSLASISLGGIMNAKNAFMTNSYVLANGMNNGCQKTRSVSIHRNTSTTGLTMSPDDVDETELLVGSYDDTCTQTSGYHQDTVTPVVRHEAGTQTIRNPGRYRDGTSTSPTSSPRATPERDPTSSLRATPERDPTSSLRATPERDPTSSLRATPERDPLLATPSLPVTPERDEFDVCGESRETPTPTSIGGFSGRSDLSGDMGYIHGDNCNNCDKSVGTSSIGSNCDKTPASYDGVITDDAFSTSSGNQSPKEFDRSVADMIDKRHKSTDPATNCNVYTKTRRKVHSVRESQIGRKHPRLGDVRARRAASMSTFPLHQIKEHIPRTGLHSTNSLVSVLPRTGSPEPPRTPSGSLQRRGVQSHVYRRSNTSIVYAPMAGDETDL